MSGTVTVTLSKTEWDLVSALRAIPASPLKERLDHLLAELVKFGTDPRCAESQADGDPCVSTRGDCESCRKVTDLIDTLARRAAQ